MRNEFGIGRKVNVEGSYIKTSKRVQAVEVIEKIEEKRIHKFQIHGTPRYLDAFLYSLKVRKVDFRKQQDVATMCIMLEIHDYDCIIEDIYTYLTVNDVCYLGARNYE